VNTRHDHVDRPARGIVRFTGRLSCFVCGGSNRLPRGHGIRCWGFLSSDGKFAHCTREDFAGGLPPEPNSATFAHLLEGDCRCGRQHGDAPAIPRLVLQRITSHRGTSAPVGKLVAIYTYRDTNGRPVMRKVRYDPKDFRREHPDGTSRETRETGWTRCNGCQHEVPLYRWKELLEADPRELVFVVEGEKTADRMAGLGFVVTTTGGVNSWRSHHAAQFPRDRDVFVLRDHDDAGLKYAETVVASIREKSRHVAVVLLPGLEDGGDPFDFIEAGGTAAQIETICRAAPAPVPGCSS
jgi:hypothetical protein